MNNAYGQVRDYYDVINGPEIGHMQMAACESDAVLFWKLFRINSLLLQTYSVWMDKGWLPNVKLVFSFWYVYCFL